MPSIQYSESPNVETAFVVQDGGQKNRAVLTAPQDTSTLELPDNPNSTKGYVTVDGKKHKVILTADISGGGSGGGAVSSVNGQTGAVVLDAQDVNAVPQYSTMPAATAQNAGEVAQYVGNTIPEHVEATQTVGTSLSNIQVNSEQFYSTGETSGTFTFDNYLSFVFNAQDSDLFNLYVTDPVGLRATIEAKLQSQGYTDSLDYIVSHLIPGDMQQDSGTMFFKSQHGTWNLWLQWVGSDSRNKQTYVNPQNYLHVDIMGEQTGYWDVYVGSMALTGWNTDLAYYGITYSGTPVADDVITAKTVALITHNYFYESSPKYSEPSATVSQTTGSSLSDLAINVAAFESAEQPTGDETTSFTYTLLSPNTINKEDTNGWSVELNVDAIFNVIDSQGGSQLIDNFTSATGSIIFDQAPSSDNFYIGLYDRYGNYYSFLITDYVTVNTQGSTSNVSTILAMTRAEYSWKQSEVDVDIADYGITYSGTPVSNDVITVNYTASALIGYVWNQTDVQKGLPSQTGNAGKFLTTNGTDISWASVSGGIDWDGATEIAYDATYSDKTNVGFDFQNLATGDYYFYIKTMQSVYINNGNKPVWQTAKVSFYWDSTWTCDNVTDFATSLRVAPVLDGSYMGSNNSYNDLLNGMDTPAACYGVSATSNRIFMGLRNKFNSTAPQNSAAQDGDIIHIVSKLFGGATPISMDNIAQAFGTYENPQSYITYNEGGNASPLVPQYNPPIHFSSSDREVSYWAQNNVVGICSSQNNMGASNTYGAASINFSASFSGGEFDGRIIYAPNGLTTSQITKATGVFETARFYIQDNTCYVSYDPTLFAALQDQTEIVLAGAWGAGTQQNIWISPNVFNKTGTEALDPNNLVPIATGMSSYITDTPTYVNLGGIIQYIGETDANYTNGFFYKANGTVIVVPESATMTATDYGDITVAVDITNLVAALMTATGWSRAQVTNNLSSYNWALDYNFDNNTVTRVYWGYYGSMFQQDILNCFTVSTTGTYIGVLYINCTMDYTSQHNVVQNGSWDRIDVQPAPQTSTGTTATLAVNDWVANEQTVNVTGVTANNNVIVAPAPASTADYTSAGIICTAQGAGTLTFTCQTTPSNAITVNVLII